MLKNEGQYVFFEGDYPERVKYDGVIYYYYKDLGKFAMYVSLGGARGTFSKRNIWVVELDEIEREETRARHMREKARRKSKSQKQKNFKKINECRSINGNWNAITIC